MISMLLWFFFPPREKSYFPNPQIIGKYRMSHTMILQPSNSRSSSARNSSKWREKTLIEKREWKNGDLSFCIFARPVPKKSQSILCLCAFWWRHTLRKEPKPAILQIKLSTMILIQLSPLFLKINKSVLIFESMIYPCQAPSPHTGRWQSGLFC